MSKQLSIKNLLLEKLMVALTLQLSRPKLRRQLLDSTVSVRTCIVILYYGESLRYCCSILQTIPYTENGS